MSFYRHSVSLETEKCKGCTHCLRRCPTEAIRIRDGHAVINTERCIDCGECIRLCPHKAKKAIYDPLESISKFKYKIALPPPTLYGQFDNLDDVDCMLKGLLDYGFDDVFEVACAAEMVTEYTRHYLKTENIHRPVISSACPVIVRLISLRFPTLAKHLIPIMPPVEIAGKLAREKAKKEHPELKDEDIGVVFISPCTAKVSYVKNALCGEKKSNIDLVVSMSDMYFELLDTMKSEIAPEPLSRTGMIGVNWATSGGESSSLLNDRYLAADGIENVIKVLDDIETGSYPCLDFIELNACPGGCVGGVLTMENPYIARVRLQNIRRYLPVSQNRPEIKEGEPPFPGEYNVGEFPEINPVRMFSQDRKTAIRLMSQAASFFETLPEIDCGYCGAPNCRAFADDVVRGLAVPEDCVVLAKKKNGSI
ncbi:MAG: 4Fe-4S dicluster domain-containing protein [Clostridia bacterium]|nr:4Fe-4S dicluster domain-containing protein [Clostridia bacterium]